MNYKKLRTELDDVLAGKHDAMFADVIAKMHCMSRARVYAVIHAIVSCMDEGETYLEIGTYQGGSLISALLGNQARAIGVDNFAEFNTTNNFEQTQGNLVKFGVADRVELKNMSYADFFAGVPADFKAQVFYYDGQHDYEGQLAGMEAGWPHLQPGSIVLVDDFLYPEVNRAINKFIANHIDHIKILVAMDSMNDCDEVWWNGVIALRVL
jgi:predicted O-methyltransferase YrrM